eukprot:925458-Lingulodinium_polyedra.AAC.1
MPLPGTVVVCSGVPEGAGRRPGCGLGYTLSVRLRGQYGLPSVRLRGQYGLVPATTASADAAAASAQG